MIYIAIILVGLVACSILTEKAIDELLPPVLMAIILFVYTLMIFGLSLKWARIIALAMFLLINVLGFCVSKKERTDESRDYSANLLKIISDRIVTPSITVCIITCAIFSMLFCTHRFMHWDDLSYWGIYAKDLFVLGRLPKGIENCSISYKDYTPIIQILECFFLNTSNEFNETRLFQINVCFLYIVMLPFLSHLKRECMWSDVIKSRKDKITHILKTVGTIVLYVIFPHVFTTQFYYKLGVDYLMSVLFGYGIWIIARDTKKSNIQSNHNSNDMCSRLYNYFCLVVASSFLCLVKSAGIVLSLFLALFYALYNLRTVGKNKNLWSIVDFFSTFSIPVLFALSWKLWSRRTGNFGYLSDIIDDNVKSLTLKFPDYTKSTTIDYVKHVFLYPLTREKVGITAALIVFTIVAIYLLRKKAGLVTESDRILHIAMCSGMFLFCLAHLYMYLFVFDEWEANGLLEFDRYINQYLAGVFFYYLYDIWDVECISDRTRKVKLEWIITSLLFLILPYKSMVSFLVPKNYSANYNSYYADIVDKMNEEWQECILNDMYLPMDEDHKIMLLADAWSDEFQFFTVAMVPQPVTVVENIPALEEGQLSDFCKDLIVQRGIDYIYIMRDAGNRYVGDFERETKVLTLDGSPLICGNCYSVIRDGDMIALKQLQIDE